MKIGYAQNIITPSLDKPVYLAGFGNNRRAETIHDDLYARALAIQSSDITLVLAALDLIGFFQADVYDIIRCVQEKHPSIQIIIAATHTHHGPDTLGLWGPDHKTSGVDREYISKIKTIITETIKASLSDLQSATVKTISVMVHGVAKNTRNPEILDEELTLVQFIGENNKPQATLINFPCHPEVLGEHNPSITSDYVGYLRDDLEKQTGASSIFFVGALGGMMTPDVKDHSFKEAKVMGRKLAEDGLKALEAVGVQPFVINVQRKEIAAKLTNPLYKVAFWRRLLPDVRDPKGYIHTEVNLIKLGNLWLATVPGEILPKLGLQLKAWMKDNGAKVTGIIGLANDELGYILPRDEFKYPLNPFKPGKHYEETNSIGKEIAPKVMEALKELIKGE